MRLSDDRTATREYCRVLDEHVNVRSFTLAAETRETLWAVGHAICAEYGITLPGGLCLDDEDVRLGFDMGLEDFGRGLETGIDVSAPRGEIRRAVSELRSTYRTIKRTVKIDVWTASESVRSGLVAGDWVQCGGSAAKVAGWAGGKTLQLIHVGPNGEFDLEQYETLRSGLQTARAD